MADKIQKYNLPVSTYSETGGVKVLSLEGRFKDVRERLSGDFTDADRAWRRQWFKDQILSKNEPRHVPEIYEELTNPFRKLYRKPWDLFFKKMSPVIGEFPAFAIRYTAPKVMIGILTFYSIAYYFKYNKNDWTKANFWKVSTNAPPTFPGDAGYPNPPKTRIAPADYYDKGFKSRKVFLN